MSLALVIDTSLAGCHVGLFDSATGRTFVRNLPMARGQSEALVPLMQEAYAAFGREMIDTANVIALTGPGSFTGLRLGLSAARTLARVAGCPGTGLSTFEAFAATAPEAQAIVIESHRDDFYVRFRQQDMLMTPQQFLESFGGEARVVFAGDGAARFLAACENPPPGWSDAAISVPDLEKAALLAVTLAARPLAPYYLRAPDVTLQKGQA